MPAVVHQTVLGICGPYNPAILTNAPTLIEQQGEWIMDCLSYLRAHQMDAIEPTVEAERHFVAQHEAIANATLIPQTASWWTGTNVAGKQHSLLSWCGGMPAYAQLCDEAAQAGYRGCMLHRGQ